MTKDELECLGEIIEKLRTSYINMAIAIKGIENRRHNVEHAEVLIKVELRKMKVALEELKEKGL